MRTRMFAAATVALAALSLTACGGNDDGVRDEGASKPTAVDSGSEAGSGSEPTSDKARTKDSGDATGSGSSTGSGGSGGSDGAASDQGADNDPGAPENRVPCSAANTSVTATPVTRPLNHMLITVTNTGSKMCDLEGHPVLKFEGAQSVPPVIEDSKPQAVTSLKPGAKGYAAAILVAGDGSGGATRQVNSLEVGFEGSDAFADATLPSEGVHIDDSLRVTYWQSDSVSALN
ncbi:DUF4232 domain-containing protein [Streptomyces silvensis]|uniref:DUF4232 domain-containing protein n=1 Tax=Streptomyces silvensis TaxID=1765722 RepID=A0A0W7X3X2_9ACTN|nr:DUF4232 domain-containing protein [Streptomyces silvensis]KUF17491.1 hypothetical protein AT728_08630 [Streptomyces silvensis]